MDVGNVAMATNKWSADSAVAVVCSIDCAHVNANAVDAATSSTTAEMFVDGVIGGVFAAVIP